MQYRAIGYMVIFLQKKKRIVIFFKKAKKFSRIINKDPSKIGKSLLSPSLLVPMAFNVLLRALYCKAVPLRAVKEDPRHKNQLFFESVITQAEIVNSIPNTKLKSTLESILKNTWHNFPRFIN